MPNPPLTIRLRHSPGYTAGSHGGAYLPPFSEDGDYRRTWLLDQFRYENDAERP